MLLVIFLIIFYLLNMIIVIFVVIFVLIKNCGLVNKVNMVGDFFFKKVKKVGFIFFMRVLSLVRDRVMVVVVLGFC